MGADTTNQSPIFKEKYGKPPKKQPGEDAIKGLKSFVTGGYGEKREKGRLVPPSGVTGPRG